MSAPPEPAVAEDGMRCIMAGRAGDTAARMRARSAQVQALERHAIIRRADHRPRAEQLVEAHLAVKDIAADQAETPLKVQRRVDLAAQHRLGESRCVSI